MSCFCTLAEVGFAFRKSELKLNENELFLFSFSYHVQVCLYIYIDMGKRTVEVRSYIVEPKG